MSLLKRIFNIDKVSLDLEDIQSIILRSRPVPYFGTMAILKIKTPSEGKALLKKILPLVSSAENWHDNQDASVTISFTFEGLKALGLPQESLDSFPESFKQGMAARAELLNDTGVNDPKNWEENLKSNDIHVAAAVISNSQESWKEKLGKLRNDIDESAGIEVIFSQDFGATEEVKNVFGFRDGISNPEIEGSGIDKQPQYNQPIKAGEFLLGYPGEADIVKPFPQPEELGKSGSFLIFRKYQSQVAAFNKFINDNSNTLKEAELLAAKMMGRWKSGAPLALSPDEDDEALGKNPEKNNDFSFKDDEYGKKCPFGAHIRRMNPRDASKSILQDIRLHRIIRKSVSFGDIVPPEVTEDDGKERGQFFMGMSADAMGTLEFLLKQWANDSNFISLGDEKDPLLGVQEDGLFTRPDDPIVKRYHGLQTYNIMKGGDYCFLPSITAIKWISDLP
ncbi:MAG: Dyp-type peroxidase [Christiangramia sp.]